MMASCCSDGGEDAPKNVSSTTYHDITSLTRSPGVHDGPLGNRISHGGHIDGFDGIKTVRGIGFQIVAD